nr:class I SAM-dependent methyltransferase [Oceanirhabdus seepicola]
MDLEAYLNDKKVLEIACGDSEFSLSASKYAKQILATDISLERFKRKNLKEIPQNIEFKEMDATDLILDNGTFDISICYNALGHLESVLNSVLMEMSRVTKENGYLLFIVSWKMDKRILLDLKEMINEYAHLKINGYMGKNRYKVLIIKNIKV